MPRCCRNVILSSALIVAAASSYFLFFTLSPYDYYGDSPDPLLMYADLEAIASSSQNQKQQRQCDLSRGRWIALTSEEAAAAPIYTNETCGEDIIQPNQNCMKNGRPDTAYLRWRWSPSQCVIPPFDPNRFLRLLRGHNMIFIGDSIARNHMQSLVCAIAQVERPVSVLDDAERMEYLWRFRRHRVTVGNIWSPFLVKHSQEKATGIYRIHLDTPDEKWLSELRRHKYDIAVFSAAYWFFRPSVYYVSSSGHNDGNDDDVILGLNSAAAASTTENLTTITVLSAMQRAWHTLLRQIVDEYEGIAVVRTVTVPHFEEGKDWSNGGTCNMTEPLDDPGMEMGLPWMSKKMYDIQTQEFARAVKRMGEGGRVSGVTSGGGATGRRGGGRRRSLQLKLADVTYLSLLRPDGHPNGYRQQQASYSNAEPRNDCLHWCLPGPIDAWNQLLYASLTGPIFISSLSPLPTPAAAGPIHSASSSSQV